MLRFQNAGTNITFTGEKEEKVGCVVLYALANCKKRPKIGLQDQLSLNAGQTYFRML